MATREFIPPRLPEPPEEIDRVYLMDLVRALEVFITQEKSLSISEESQSVSFFLK
jgi:hypothetical protein